jgi:ATP-dependent Zn protease
LATLTKIRWRCAPSCPLPPPKPTIPISPNRYGLPFFSPNNSETKDFLDLLGPYPQVYSPLYPWYQAVGRGKGQYTELLTSLSLKPHHPTWQRENIREIKAVHEAGHIAASILIPQSMTPFISATLGSRFSRTTFDHSRDDILRSNEEAFKALICRHLAGLAAEQIYYGCVSPKASDLDIRYALNELEKHYSSGHYQALSTGKLSYWEYFSELWWIVTSHLIPRKEEQVLCDLSLSYLQEQYRVVRGVLQGKEGSGEGKELVTAIATELLKKGKLERIDIDGIIRRR